MNTVFRARCNSSLAVMRSSSESWRRKARDPCNSKADLVKIQSQRLQSGWKKTMTQVANRHIYLSFRKPWNVLFQGFFFGISASSQPKMVFAMNMKGGASL